MLDVTTPTEPALVRAWIAWKDGVDELVVAQAVAWTNRAVRVRWGVPPRVFETWVWAGAVSGPELSGWAAFWPYATALRPTWP